MTTQAASPLADARASKIRSWPADTVAILAIAALTMGVLGLLAGLLVSPGRSLIGVYANDLMVFYDGAHRLLDGQIPNRDFHTPLGPLAYLLPAFGLWAGGSLGAMLPLATALFAVLLAAPLFYVAASRLPFAAACLFVLYVAVLAAAPINPGDNPLKPTFAMFYNRFGWAALSVLLVMALPRVRRIAGPVASVALDAACIGWLLLLLFYLKLSYAAVGLAFVAALAILPSSRRHALFGLLGAACAMLLVEAVWRRTGAYLSDASAAAAVSGAVRGGAYTLITTILANLQQLSVYAAALVLGLARGTRPVWLLASAIMALCGVLLINQNAQELEIPVLLPAVLVATLAPAGAEGSATRPAFAFAGFLLAAAVALPAIANGAFGLRFFRHELNHAPPSAAAYGELDGIVTHEGSIVPGDPTKPMLIAPNALAQAFRRGVGDTETLSLLRHYRTVQPISQSEYLATLHDGAAVLRADPRLAGTVYTFDLQNPFNAMLGRRPPRGDASWNHYGRTFNEHAFIPPEQALADVQVIMDPKDPVEAYSARMQKKIYADYLAKHFVLATESTYWRAYRRISGEPPQ